GRKQVFRRPGYADLIALVDEQPPPDGVPLLEPVMREGHRVSERTKLNTARQRFVTDLAALPTGARTIRVPTAPRAEPSECLTSLASGVRRRIEQNLLGHTHGAL
ncbi:nicotinate phosphoribosyltransferase, partial [Streptomyces sp. NPDC056237]